MLYLPGQWRPDLTLTPEAVPDAPSRQRRIQRALHRLHSRTMLVMGSPVGDDVTAVTSVSGRAEMFGGHVLARTGWDWNRTTLNGML